MLRRRVPTPARAVNVQRYIQPSTQPEFSARFAISLPAAVPSPSHTHTATMPATIGKAAPDFAAKAVMPDGSFKDVKLSDYKGAFAATRMPPPTRAADAGRCGRARAAGSRRARAPLRGCARVGRATAGGWPCCASAGALTARAGDRQVRGALLLPAGLHVRVPGARRGAACARRPNCRAVRRAATAAERAAAAVPARRRRSSPSRTAPRTSRPSTRRCGAAAASFSSCSFLGHRRRGLRATRADALHARARRHRSSSASPSTACSATWRG